METRQRGIICISVLSLEDKLVLESGVYPCAGALQVPF
jgi:hypothetical protein